MAYPIGAERGYVSRAEARKNPHLKRGLRRAGFKGEWLDAQT